MCRLDRDLALKRKVFDKYGINPESTDYELKWFGTAPLCNGTPCDAINQGYIPVLGDEYGDGSKCMTGEKYLGLKIKNDDWGRIFEEYSGKYKEMCMEFDISDKKTKNAILESIFDM